MSKRLLSVFLCLCLLLPCTVACFGGTASAETISYGRIDYSTGGADDGELLTGTLTGSLASVETCPYNGAKALLGEGEGDVAHYTFDQSLADTDGNVGVIVRYYLTMNYAFARISMGKNAALSQASCQAYRAAGGEACHLGSLEDNKWATVTFTFKASDYASAPLVMGLTSFKAKGYQIYVSDVVVCPAKDTAALNNYLFGVDRSALRENIALGEKATASAGLTAALTAAKAVDADITATQAQVDAASDALMEALIEAGVVDAPSSEGYIIADLGYKMSSNYASFTKASNFPPIDLTQYGYPTTGVIEPGKLGLQFDLYLSGEDEVTAKFLAGQLDGQIEITSSGTCDKQEFSLRTPNLKFVANDWTRQVIDLSRFNVATGTFDPTNFNFFRIYANKWSDPCKVKIYHVRLVDLTKRAPSLTEDPLGDGTFIPDPPVWRQITVADGFNDDGVVVAGYDLAEYAADHDMTEVTDWAPIIQSLLDGLYTAGGGTLFIPAGHYPCRDEIAVPTGVTMCGEWKNPDESPAADGTVLEVYNSKGNASGVPFITLTDGSLLRNLAFWYPEQSFTAPVEYPATVLLSGSTHADNVTFYNSYVALQHGPDHHNCPNVNGVYGTPLYSGMDVDGVVDIARLENIHFAPDYWIASGLAGAPAAEEDAQALRSFLYYNATGIILRRIDWSYLTFATVKGYNTGLILAESVTSPGEYPYGQCYGLLFEDCSVGIYAFGLKTQSEMVTHSTFKNCANGVWLGAGSGSGVLQLTDVDMDADIAVRQEQGSTVLMTSSVVRRGTVTVTSGRVSVSDTQFLCEAPQVVMESGAAQAVLLGCTDANGKPIQVENPGLCAISRDDAAQDVPEVQSVEAAEALPQVKSAAKAVAYIADDLDNTGAADVTAALQQKLDAAKTAGGGVVWLPGGTYRLDGSVTVPGGVELAGNCDFARMPVGAGTEFIIKGAPEKPAFVLEEKAGLRGFTVTYPEQFAGNKIVAYPYTIKGTGADIYVINVTLDGASHGVDLMSERCDRHYVSGLFGRATDVGIAIGHGAEDGVLRDQHFNILNTDIQKYIQENLVPILVGDVKNELIYNCFTYGCFAGLQFVAEESGAAEALVIGQGVDYATVDIDVEAAEAVQLINTQMTAFNQLGSQVTLEQRNIRLGKDVQGTVDFVAAMQFGNSDLGFEVEGGTLRISGFAFASASGKVVRVSEGAEFKLINGDFSRSADLSGQAGTAAWIGGFTDSTFSEECTYVQTRIARWDAPLNAQFPEYATLEFTEAFTDYDFQSFKKALNPDATASASSGRLELVMNHATSMGVTANIPLEDGLFWMETRLNVRVLQATENSRVLMILTLANGDLIYSVNILKGTGLLVGGADTPLAEVSEDEWYRLAIELDLRDPAAASYRVVLMSDEYEELAASEPVAIETLPDERLGVKSVWIGSMSDKVAGDDVPDKTRLALDYVFVAREGEPDVTLGDVNGDEKIDSTDARLILQYYAKKIGEEDLNIAAADVNADGKVDSTDARLILQLYAKKISEFPVA